MRCRVTHSPEEAAERLRAGGLVALPTETVYGLGGNALDPHAVAQIFAVKERPTFDPLIVHLASPAQLPRVASDVPLLARQLADRFWPGPLTLVLPKTANVPDLVTSGLPTVAVRIPSHPLMRRVLQLTGLPIAAPSANLFGRLSPTTVEHVLDQLGDRMDLVLEGGPCTIGVESTIVQVIDGSAVLLRPGGITTEAIEDVIGPVNKSWRQGEQPIAPGQLPSHYSPCTPLRVLRELPETAPTVGVAALVFSPRSLTGYHSIEVLSLNDDFSEAAANLFPALHRLDSCGCTMIFAERFPNRGLGCAINDRIDRASANP